MTLTPLQMPSNIPSVILNPYETLIFTDQSDDWRSLLFQLAIKREPENDPVLRFWKRIAETMVSALCRLPDEYAPRNLMVPTHEKFEEWAESAPPMVGAEYLTPWALESIWLNLTSWVSRKVRDDGGLSKFLQNRAPHWQRVGRVTFHLAENPADPERPFAFMATYVTGFNEEGRDNNLPLGLALKQYTSEGDKVSLLGLLNPVRAAAEKLPWVNDMVSDGSIYRPLAFSISKAHRLLMDAPILEESGLTLRIPDWWKKRPQVRVKMEIEKKNSIFGVDSLLDWDVKLAVGDQNLSPSEIAEILASDQQMVFVKGRWLEADRDKLKEVLEHWQKAKNTAGEGEISFLKAMRLLAGLPSESRSSEAYLEEPSEWFVAEAGAGLKQILEKLRDPEAMAQPPELLATLRPYQEKGLAWLSLLTGLGLGACLADDMGLGKTMQVLALLLLDKKRLPKPKASLLIAPASLLGNWRSEADRFAPDLRLNIYHPSETSKDLLAAWEKNPKKLMDSSDLIVTSYALLLRRLDLFSQLDFRMVIIDEAQAIKNAGTGQTRAVKKIKADARLALTGTPIENSLSDIWSLFDYLNPGLLGSAKKFKESVKDLETRDSDQYAPLRRLVAPYLLRRLKTDKRIINDLPDKTETVAHCWLSATQAKLYSQIVEQLKQTLESITASQVDQMKRRGLVLQSLMRLKQLCNHPAHLTGDGDWDPALSGKFQRVAELATEMAERQDKLLIFTQFQEIIGPLGRFLTEIFHRSGLELHGGTPVHKRKDLVDLFQKDDGPPFFILSLKAGGTGLNLTAASQVIHFDRWWNPAVEDQATDRAFRIGQKKNVLVHKCVTKGTMEEKVDNLLRTKRELANEILGQSSEMSLVNLNDEELLKLISLDINRAVMGG